MQGRARSTRKAGLARTLELIQFLGENTEGLTVTEMANFLKQSRRSAERTRALIGGAFTLESALDDSGHKRWRIPTMNDAVASPTVKELGALANEAAAAAASNSPRAVHLLSLSRRLRASLKWELKRKMGSDLDLIDQVQRTRVGPGPRGTADPVVYDVISLAILQGRCVDFSYRREGRSEVKQVRVVPFGVVHSTVSYLVAQPTKEGDAEARYYRFDRILMPAISDELGTAPKGFDLDDWLAQSFNIWREPPHDVRIRILASGVARALDWQFHPRQRLTNEGDTLLIEFTCGGLREIAEHLFGWAGQVEIIGPPQLIECMREQLALAATCIPDAKA